MDKVNINANIHVNGEEYINVKKVESELSQREVKIAKEMLKTEKLPYGIPDNEGNRLAHHVIMINKCQEIIKRNEGKDVN